MCESRLTILQQHIPHRDTRHALYSIPTRSVYLRVCLCLCCSGVLLLLVRPEGVQRAMNRIYALRCFRFGVGYALTESRVHTHATLA